MGLLLESAVIEIFLAILALFWFLYSNVTQKYSQWKDRGVPHIQPVFPFGSLKEVFLGRRNYGDMYQVFYTLYKDERFFGIHEMRQPILIIKDPELIKHVLTKDFQYFSDRVVLPIDKQNDYISNHLFLMNGKDWKIMRSKLTPTFTSGRMKMMFLLMLKSSEQLKDHVKRHIEDNPEVDVKDVLARFTMDIIASCAFGLEINTQSDKDCEFYRYGSKVFKPNNVLFAKRLFFSFLPFMNKLFTQRFTPADVSEFLTRIVQETVEYREKNNFNRNDFLDLLIKIRQNKSLLEDGEHINGDSDAVKQNPVDKTGLTIEEITAQAFIFFFAGFETASSTMTFCLYELACNPDVQHKLYKEIKEVLAKHDGKPSYQALQEMTYMDHVINETLRRYSSLAILNRTCSETYKVPQSDLVLEKGQKVTIPIYAIHHDPEYYPDPYKFDPDRFTPEKKKERHPYVHLPFGEGPRMCIGMRFGLLQTKLGLTEMISSFEFGLAPSMKIPVAIHKRAFITQPETPIILRLTKRVGT